MASEPHVVRARFSETLYMTSIDARQHSILADEPKSLDRYFYELSHKNGAMPVSF